MFCKNDGLWLEHALPGHLCPIDMSKDLQRTSQQRHLRKIKAPFVLQWVGGVISELEDNPIWGKVREGEDNFILALGSEPLRACDS